LTRKKLINKNLTGLRTLVRPAAISRRRPQNSRITVLELAGRHFEELLYEEEELDTMIAEMDDDFSIGL
jgi:hypothetical protein